MHQPGKRRLMCVLAHPDDESFGFGGTLAKYAAEGIETYLVTATRGEQGWIGPPDAHPGPTKLGRIREAELRDAAQELGVRRVDVMGYRDGELDQAHAGDAVARIVDCLRDLRPQVVLTFGPEGATGHPDHIAISQLTTAAVVCAANPVCGRYSTGSPHVVTKLYYLAPSPTRINAYNSVFGGGMLRVNGEERRVRGWDDWAITTHIDASDRWRQVWRAITCHRTQLPDDHVLQHLTEAEHRILWGIQEYYRVVSLVNSSQSLEHDLFAGIDQQVDLAREGKEMPVRP